MLNQFLTVANRYLWNYILIFLLIGLGLYMTIKLRFPQFRRMKAAFRVMFGRDQGKEGGLSPVQSLSMAIASQVGVGNVVGIATAIISGGPGAAFWMWVSGFLGMATLSAESVLALRYRERHDGEIVGGPAYTIKNGLHSKALGSFFAGIAIVSLGFIGAIIQSNSVAESMSASFNLSPISTGVMLFLIIGAIIIGGMSRIGEFAARIVPIMAGLYILGSLVIIFANITSLGEVIKLIFVGAFTPQAIGGGTLGITMSSAVRYGLARGLYSNEAGMGSIPHSHAVATPRHPAEQGFTAMIGVLVSTFIVCTATVIVNLASGQYAIFAKMADPNASVLTQASFNTVFGQFGGPFISISLAMFALTTIISWYFFALNNVKYFFHNKTIIRLFSLLSMAMLIVGPLTKPGIVWQMSDFFMGMMALPNIIVNFLLANKAKEVYDDYDRQIQKGEKLHWHYEFEEEQK